MARNTKAQQMLETMGMMFPYYFNMPDVSQELGNMDTSNVNVPDWNKGVGGLRQDWETVPQELSLRGSPGFVNMSAKRCDGPGIIDATGKHGRPARLAERLLKYNENNQSK